MTDGMTKIRKIQLELLEAFSGVCGTHDLNWYAFFGTLLGTVRNEGYLPLDDDIDVAMPMKDYRELCTHKDWFAENDFVLQTPLDDGGCRHARLHKTGTTAFRNELVEELRAGGAHGISIDIIPLEELPGMECYHTPSVSGELKRQAVYRKEWLEPAGTGKFEHLTVRLPAKSRRVLTETYGDWAWPHGAKDSRPVHWFADTERGWEVYVRRYTGMLEGTGQEKIYLFGASDSLRIWLERFGLKNRVVCTFDNDPKKWGKEVYGVAVRNPEEIREMMKADSRMIVVSLWHLEIGKQLEDMGISDYFVYLDDYYDESIGNKVVRREDLQNGETVIPRWM